MEHKPDPALKILTQQQIKERTTQIPGMGTLYANHARIAPSFYDVRFFFGQSSVTPTGEQTVQEQVCIILSPECAMMLAAGLATGLQQFEKFFGPLRAMPSFPPESHPPAQKKKKK